jgi:hypothetical protein
LAERKELVANYVTKWQHKTSGFDMLARFVGRWQNWLATRRAAEHYARFVHNRLTYRDKAWAFDRLRNQKRAVHKAFAHTARADIIQK